MSRLSAYQLTLIIVVVVGATVAFVTRSCSISDARAPVLIALVAIWGLASLAVARFNGRRAMMSIPALATFVLSIAALVVVQLQHRPALAFALASAALSVVLVRAAIRFDRCLGP